jgi:hypothetical protein
VVLAKGQRALVGKVSMDQHAPPGTAQTTAQDLAGAAQVVAYVKVGWAGGVQGALGKCSVLCV